MAKWRVLIIFWLIYLLNYADRQVLSSVLPLVKKEWLLSDTQLGALSGVFFWVFAPLVLVSGNLADTLSRRWIIIGSLIVWSAATAGSGMVGAFTGLLVMRGLTAFGEAFYYPAANSMIGDLHGSGSRSTAMSLHQTAVYIGTMTSGTAAAYLGQQYGWRSAFWIFGAAGIVMALVVAAFLPEPVRGAADSQPVVPMSLRQRFQLICAKPTVLLLTLGTVSKILVLSAYLSWTPTMLFRKFGISLTQAGFHATFWHNLGAIAGVLVGGRLADALHAKTNLSRPLIQLIGLSGGIPFIYLLGSSSDFTTVMVSLGIFGFCRGLFDSNEFAAVYDVIRPEARATVTGMMMCLGFIAGGFAPLAIGRLGETLGLDGAMSWLALVYAFGALSVGCACLFTFRRDLLLQR